MTGAASMRRLRALAGPVTAVLGAVALVVDLRVVPPDAVQGQAQRLLYVHVPAAWLAYLCFTGVLLCSVAYLRSRDLLWDRRAQAAAELGVGSTALTLILGSLWGRPVWGVWWVWDPRLVTTAVLLLLYVGYLGVRGLSTESAVNARRSAIVGVLAFADLPVVHFSVVWWRTLHQPPTLLAPSLHPPMESDMLAALMLSVVTFTALGSLMFARRLAQLAEGPSAKIPPPTGDPLAAVPVQIRVRSSS